MTIKNQIYKRLRALGVENHKNNLVVAEAFIAEVEQDIRNYDTLKEKHQLKNTQKILLNELKDKEFVIPSPTTAEVKRLRALALANPSPTISQYYATNILDFRLVFDQVDRYVPQEQSHSGYHFRGMNLSIHKFKQAYDFMIMRACNTNTKHILRVPHLASVSVDGPSQGISLSTTRLQYECGTLVKDYPFDTKLKLVTEPGDVRDIVINHMDEVNEYWALKLDEAGL